MTNTVDLKTNRDLLTADFEGYKLSLDPLPVFRTELPTLFSTRSCGENQFSFLHAKLFSMHSNILTYDRWNKEHVAFLTDTSTNTIYQITDHSNGTNANLEFVWTASKSKEGLDGSYNGCLVLASDNLAVYSDGQGVLYVMKTGNRSQCHQWTTLHHFDELTSSKPFTVTSSVLMGTELQILLHYVEEKGTTGNNIDTTVNVLEWISLVDGKVDRVRRYVFWGELDHLELTVDQEKCWLLCLCDEKKPFELVFDSCGIDEKVVEEEIEKKVEEEEKPPPFYWLQGVEDMAVWVMLPPEGCTKRDIKVVLKPSHLSVKVKDKTVIDGKLWNVLDSESMTWTIEKSNKIEITMCKANVGIIWQRFLVDKDVPDGEEVMDVRMVDTIHEQLAHLTTDDPMPEPAKDKVFNTEELEACDDEEKSTVLCAVSDGGSTAAHRVPVGNRQILFHQYSNDVGLPSQVCLRHDVDGLLWQPKVNSGHLSFEHVATYCALGYVQASKQQRCFSVASPDQSYVALIDRKRHVYIYRRPEPISTELRNRKSGQKIEQVAKQQVITLEKSDEPVLGALATVNTLFVATTGSLFSMKIH